MRRSIFIFLILLFAYPVQADMLLLDAGSSTAKYVGPGDVVSGATLWVGLRAFSAVTRGTAAVDVCNSTGGVDVGCADLSTDAITGALVPATVAGITCPGTNCTIKTWYDQTGNGHNFAQVIVAARATLNANCSGIESGIGPCAQFNNVSGYTALAGTAIPYPLTISAVFNRTYSASGQSLIGADNAATTYTYLQPGGANKEYAASINGVIFLSNIADGSWHAVQGVFNSLSSSINIDTATQTGDLGTIGIIITDTFHLGSDGYGENWTGYFVEGGIWPISFSGGQVSAMNDNQFNYWHIPIIISANFALFTPSSGPWLAYNSVWNKGALVNGVDFTQSLTLYPSPFPTNTLIQWSWPNSAPANNVYSYPSVNYGVIDSGGTNIMPTTPPTGMKVSAFSNLLLSHNVSIASADVDQFDVCYDGYLTASLNTTKLFEITPCIHTPSYLATYVNGLATKYTYIGDGITWTIGVTIGAVPQIIAMPNDASDILMHTIDLKAMLAFLVTQGAITGNEYLSGIGLGVEPQKNSGTMTINSLNITWN